MKRLFLLTLTFMLLSFGVTVSANDIICHGQVIDEVGEPVIGATISVDGSNIAVATDIDGKFKINLPSKTKSLKVSYIGP